MAQALLQTLLPQISDIRRSIHQYPELSQQEKQTAQLVMETLAEFGYDDIHQCGGEGVVALIDSGKPGKTIGLRADMDALPIQEANTFAHCSQNQGVMHACGHDGHTATLLCVAAILANTRDQWSGKIKLIFQPAEETGTGAKAMIEHGVLDNPTVDEIYGMHNWPGLPAGHIAVRAGCILSGTDAFDITINGQGGHSSMPDKTHDPMKAGCLLKSVLENLPKSLSEQHQRSVLTLTRFHCGTAHNVIADSMTLGGAFRTLSPQARQQLMATIDQTLAEIGKQTTTDLSINYLHSVPATINTEKEAKKVYQAAVNALGESQVTWLPESLMPTEDFAYFLQQVPGCYFLTGNGEDSAQLHTPNYDFNEKLIRNAVQVFIAIINN